MKWLCRLGIHWRVTKGGGMFGDSLKCQYCGRDKYPEVFGTFIHEGASTMAMKMIRTRETREGIEHTVQVDRRKWWGRWYTEEFIGSGALWHSSHTGRDVKVKLAFQLDNFITAWKRGNPE